MLYGKAFFFWSKRKNWFHEYQFSKVIHSSLAIDFIFEGIFNKEDGINEMALDPDLNTMRRLANKFLDENSRSSAFGVIDSF